MILTIIVLRINAVKYNIFNNKAYRQGYWDGVLAYRNGDITDDDIPSFLKESAEDTPTAEPTVRDASKQPSKSLAALSTRSTQPRKKPLWNFSYQQTNINIALYAACLLLVAGVILSLQTITSVSVAVLFVWLFIVVFYSTGLFIYHKIAILRPVGLAFVGTAIAALPAVALAMYYILNVDLYISLLVVSLVGTAMSYAAGYYVKHDIVGYASLVGIVASSYSILAVSQVILVWYYVVLIILGTVLTYISYTAKGLRKHFSRPITTISPFIVPITAILMLIFIEFLTPLENATLFSSIVAYYLTLGRVESSGKAYELYITIARIMFIAAVSEFVRSFVRGAGIADEQQWSLITIALVSLLQAAASVMSITKNSPRYGHHSILLWLGSLGALLAPFIAHLSSSTMLQKVSATLIYIALSATITFAVVRLHNYKIGFIGSLSVLGLSLSLSDTVSSLENVSVEQSALYSALISYITLYIAAFMLMGARIYLLQDEFKRKIAKSRQLLILLVYGTIFFWLGWILVDIYKTPSLPAYYIWSAITSLWAAIAGLLLVIKERIPLAIIITQLLGVACGWLMAQHFTQNTIVQCLIVGWLNLTITIALSLSTRHFIANNRQTLFSQALLGCAIVLGGLTVLHTGLLSPSVWIAFALLFYYSAWYTKQAVIIAFGHSALLAAALAFGRLFNIEEGILLSSISWGSIVAFGAAYYICEFQALAPRLLRYINIFFVTTPSFVAAFALLLQPPSLQSIVTMLGLVTSTAFSVYNLRNIMLAGIAGSTAVIVAALHSMQYFSVPHNIAVSLLIPVALTFFISAYWLRRGYKDLSGLDFISLFSGGALWTIFLSSQIYTTKPYCLLAGAALVIIAAGFLYEAIYRRKPVSADVAIMLALFGVIPPLVKMLPNIHSMILSHLAAAIIAVGTVVYWRQHGSTNTYTRIHTVLTLIVLTMFSLNAATRDVILERGIFIIEHVALILLGINLQSRLVSIWGAFGITIAVLTLLSGHTYLLYIFTGLALLAGVTRLIKNSGTDDKE